MIERDPLDITHGPNTVRLPCGARGWRDPDGIGIRCFDCLTVYGSLGCPCTREKTDEALVR